MYKCEVKVVRRLWT